jgi:hypothetical protein
MRQRCCHGLSFHRVMLDGLTVALLVGLVVLVLLVIVLLHSFLVCLFFFFDQLLKLDE